MSGHIQIPVQKEGSYDENSWSERTLTLDLATETATISRHNHPKDLYHHSMRVLGIQKYPHVNTSHTGHGHDSPEAHMTLNIIGMKAPTQKFGNDDVTSEGSKSAGTGTTTPGERPSPSNGGATGNDVDDSWMIRCATPETYEAAVKLLEAMVHARQKREAGHTNHHAKDAAALKNFPLPENATAPVVLPTTHAKPVL